MLKPGQSSRLRFLILRTFCPLSPEEIVQLSSLGLAVSCNTRHLSRAAGEVAASAAGGGLHEHRRGLACKPPGPESLTLHVQFQSYRKSPYHGRLLACGVARNHHPDLWLDHLREICPSGLRCEELVHHAA